MNMLRGPFFLKVSAVLFAVITYFFIHNEIRNGEKEKKTLSDPSYKLIKLTAKRLPVNVRLASSPPEGFRILTQGVTTQPSHVLVVGPEALLEGAQSANTALIDVSETAKTVVKRIPLESVAGIPLSGDPTVVEVTVPIEKIEDQQK